jgi:hypothetical protein
VGIIVGDLPPMLRSLIDDDEGRFHVHFGSDTFNVVWDLAWRGDSLTVDSNWYSVHGGYEDLLNARPTLDVGRQDFICEWKPLLRRVLDAVDESGIEISDRSDVDSLRDLDSLIREPGILYR